MTVSKGIGWSISAKFPGTSFYSKLAPVLRTLVDGLFVRDDLTHVGRRGARLVKLTSASLDKVMKDREHRSWYLASSADPDPEVTVDCHRLDNDLSLDITLLDDGWRRHAATLAPTLEALTWSVVEGFGAKTQFSGGIHLAFDPPISIPKALQERRRPAHPTGVMEVLDRRNAKLPDMPEWTARYRKLLDGATPKTVRVSERGDVVLRFWTDELGDETALRAACKRYQQWLVKTVP